jgi:twitching motility protein PilI
MEPPSAMMNFEPAKARDPLELLRALEQRAQPYAGRLPDVDDAEDLLRWLNGIAHVRGRLVSVVDLCRFLSGESGPVRRSTRMLLVERGDLVTGLVVDEVLGLKQLLDDLAPMPPSGLPTWLLDFVSETMVSDAEEWGVFNLESLLASPDFQQASQ